MVTNGLNHETHEIHEKKTQNHEWTRMDTNGLNHETHEIHEKKKQNHKWTRMYTNGLNHETHEIHEKKKQNHKWTRMYTNGLNHETHEIHERDPEPRMDTNGREWIEPRNTRNTRKGSRTTNGHECTRISSIHYTDSLVVRGVHRWVHAFAPPTASTLPLPHG